MFNVTYKLTDVGIRTANLKCGKRTLSQLSHNHCPTSVVLTLRHGTTRTYVTSYAFAKYD